MIQHLVPSTLVLNMEELRSSSGAKHARLKHTFVSECKEESTLAGGTSKGRTRERIRKNCCQGDGSPPVGGGGGGQLQGGGDFKGGRGYFALINTPPCQSKSIKFGVAFAKGGARPGDKGSIRTMSWYYSDFRGGLCWHSGHHASEVDPDFPFAGELSLFEATLTINFEDYSGAGQGGVFRDVPSPPQPQLAWCKVAWCIVACRIVG